MSGEQEGSSELTQARTHTQAPPLADVSPASVLKLTRITEDYLCPPQARHIFLYSLYISRSVFIFQTSGQYLWYRLYTLQDQRRGLGRDAV